VTVGRSTMSIPTIRAFLAGLVDYAGLFPPAGLPLDRAAANYAEYARGARGWALGRFVLPASRLAEFETAAKPLKRGDQEKAWRLSALSGPELAKDVEAILDFNRRNAAGVAVDTVEIKVREPEEIRASAELLPHGIHVFFEIPIDRDPQPLLAALKAAKAGAKARTGGVTAEMFPSPLDLARFLHGCASEQIPFKVTAGLHHAWRGVYRLTYEPDSPTAMMHGFVNLFLAAVFAAGGAPRQDTIALLTEEKPDALVITYDAMSWRRHHASCPDIESARRRLALSFGSCSLEEPLGEVAALGWS
jgi:hypothetical protein